MSDDKKNITLKSSDGLTLVVDMVVALESKLIKQMVEEDCANNAIPLPKVTGSILTKVIDYCKKHAKEGQGAAGASNEFMSGESSLDAFDAEFVKVDLDVLYDLIVAADFLNIPGLLDLTNQTVAHMIKGKTPDEIRKTLNIKNDFIPHEYEELQRDNKWALE